MIDGNPWCTFDAATQLYRDGVIDRHEYDDAVMRAFGPDDGALVLGAVLVILDA